MNNNNLGAKIKKYRKRAGMSQMDLELAIDAAHGSISRMEKGRVNPNKETIVKITSALNLTQLEVGNLHDIYSIPPKELMLAVQELITAKDLDELLQSSMEITRSTYVNYNGSVLFLIGQGENSNKVYANTVTNIQSLDIVLKHSPKKFKEFNTELSVDSNNFIVKSIINNEIFHSFELYDFARGFTNKVFTKLVSKTLLFRSGIVLPLTDGDHVIGAVFYAKNSEELFTEKEISFLKVLNANIGISIKNIKRIETLQEQLKSYE